MAVHEAMGKKWEAMRARIERAEGAAAIERETQPFEGNASGPGRGAAVSGTARALREGKGLGPQTMNDLSGFQGAHPRHFVALNINNQAGANVREWGNVRVRFGTIPASIGSSMTLAEILSKYPVGSDERLNALAEWRKSEDERLGANPPVRVPTGKRVGRPPSVPAVIAQTLPVPVDEAERRRTWERRRDEAQRIRDREQADAIKARVKKAVGLTVTRINALTDLETKRAKLRRLAELEASLVANPKTVAISRGFADIEARLERLSADKAPQSL